MHLGILSVDCDLRRSLYHAIADRHRRLLAAESDDEDNLGLNISENSRE